MSTNRIIFIVDDDADITLLFHDILNSINGITVLTFTDPILALQHFQVNEHAYVLVISDFKMSGLNGMELLKKMVMSLRIYFTLPQAKTRTLNMVWSSGET
ncbi:MAG: response regulator [Thermoproteota archaeon]|nr:response regulator [Thermoproteota archaeon]